MSNCVGRVPGLTLVYSFTTFAENGTQREHGQKNSWCLVDLASFLGEEVTIHNTGISLLLSASVWVLLSPPIEHRETLPFQIWHFLFFDSHSVHVEAFVRLRAWKDFPVLSYPASRETVQHSFILPFVFRLANVSFRHCMPMSSAITISNLAFLVLRLCTCRGVC